MRYGWWPAGVHPEHDTKGFNKGAPSEVKRWPTEESSICLPRGLLGCDGKKQKQFKSAHGAPRPLPALRAKLGLGCTTAGEEDATTSAATQKRGEDGNRAHALVAANGGSHEASERRCAHLSQQQRYYRYTESTFAETPWTCETIKLFSRDER